MSSRLCLRSCGQRLAVYGHVASVCPLLLVKGTSFFFFWLTDDTHSLPVLVKVGHSPPQDRFLRSQTVGPRGHPDSSFSARLQERSRLWWSQCLCVGDRVCVTSLDVCIFQDWKGNRVFYVNDCSELHTNYSLPPGEDSSAGSQQDTPPSSLRGACPAAGSQRDTPPPMSCCDDDTNEPDPQRTSVQTGSRIKHSRIINYQVSVRQY